MTKLVKQTLSLWLFLFLSLACGISYGEAPSNESLPELSRAPSVLKILQSPEYKKIFSSGDGDNFCRLSDELCIRLTGNSNCVPKNIEPTFEKRVEQIKHWYSQQFLQDKKALSLCCNGNMACNRYLQSIPVKISYSDETRERLAIYDFYNKEMLVSDTAINKCHSMECLQEVVLHEMGHACQAATFEKDNFAAKGVMSVARGLLVTGQGIFSSATAGYSGVIGPKKAQCIQKALAQQAARMDQAGFNHSDYSWTRESMADAVFANLKNTPLHWKESCNGNTNELYADRRAYLPCLFINE